MSTGQLTLHRPRLSVLRRQGNQVLTRGVRRTVATARRTPMPAPVRRVLSTTLMWRPGTQAVRVDRILLGGQNGQEASAVVAATGDLLWPSREVAAGPHADLLRLGREHLPSDEEILGSSYAALARACIRTTGQYFSATGDAGILDLARDYLARVHGGPAEITARPNRSAPGTPVLLAPIRGSDCYQVVDGHHRVALAAERGATTVEARIRRLPVTTPIQDLLEQMSWIGGERELYQPVGLPELASGWTVVRRCTDRLALMTPYLDEIRDEIRDEASLAVPAPSYLDVASCYGWFVDQVGRRGFRAEGIERDPVARTLGPAVYGLDPAQITTGDATEFLATAGRSWDVVSCFSLLHHFVLGRGPTSAEELLRRLDRVTGRVLFLDTGQAHEAWFRESLPEWDTARVAAFLTEHATFDRVIDLGPDQDAVGPYADNYGRHLFACVRDR